MTTDYSAYTDAQLKDAQHHIKALENIGIAPSVKPDLHEVFESIDAEKKRRLNRKYVIGSLVQEFRGVALTAAQGCFTDRGKIDAILESTFRQLHNEGRVTTASGQGLEWQTVEEVPEGEWFERVDGNHHHYIKVKYGDVSPSRPGTYSAGRNRTGPILSETPGNGPFRPAQFAKE